jgi:hypothetical protein
VLQHRGIGRRLQPGLQDCLLLAAHRARAARNWPTLKRASLALLHHGAFDRGHRYLKAASGFSHGQTVCHRAHQAFFQIRRIATHALLLRTFRAGVCLCFSQVAVVLGNGSPVDVQATLRRFRSGEGANAIWRALVFLATVAGSAEPMAVGVRPGMLWQPAGTSSIRAVD